MPTLRSDKFDDRRLVPGSRFKLAVKGFSMRPEILPGDSPRIEAIQPESISVGDIVVFRKGGRLIAHHIVKKELALGQFIEKGDSKFRPYPIDLGSVIGKVTAVERIGGIKRFDDSINRKLGRAIAFLSYYKFIIITKLSKIKT